MRRTARSIVRCVRGVCSAEGGARGPALGGEDAVAIGGRVAGPGDVVGVVGYFAASVGDVSASAF